MRRTCDGCGTVNSDSARFCMGCGRPLLVGCAHCGEALPEGARFCPGCGSAAESTIDGGEMLKVVTVMFADVVGSTAQAEARVPEETRLVMSEFFAAMSEEIKAEGGTIDRFIGDAIMAEFGIPNAHEDDPLRAVRAARRMLERLEKWNLERPESTRIQVRVGINTGTVSTGGSLGDELRVVGDAVNVAARLEQVALPGSIVVGERTARAVRSFYELTPLDPLRLKGKSKPVAAFVVGDDLLSSLHQDVLEVRAPMVGREAELSRLESSLEQTVLQKKPQLVTVIGDGGVGKSRLLHEFTASLENVKVLHGRCSPHGEGPALWPFGEILREETGVLRTDSTEIAFAKLESYATSAITIDDLEPGLAVAVLAFTLGIETEDSPLAGRDPREIHRDLLRVWRALFSSLAQRSPLLVIIEDIHWADATVLDSLGDLVRFTEGRIMFACSARPDLFRDRPEWGTSVPGHSSLSLECLPPEQSTALVTHLLGAEALSERDRNRIVERSEGNPFYLEEIIRRLIDEDYIVQEEDRWRVARNVSELEIPDNVQAVIASRIDLLSPSERKTLQLAAVVGRTFWAGALSHLDPSLDTSSVLNRLARREFVGEQLTTSVAGDTEYSFKHALIRDVAYESLPRMSRGQAHADVTKWMEQKAGDRVDEVAELLAHHYGMALGYLKQDQEALRRGARRNCLVASKAAVRRFAFKQAEEFGRRAVELSPEGAEKIEALEALGDAYYVTFDSDSAWSCYCEAVAALESEETQDTLAMTRLCAKAAIVPTRWWGSMREPPDVEKIKRVIASGLEANGGRETRDLSILLSSKSFLQIMGYEPIDEEGERAAQKACEIAEGLNDADLLSVALDAVTFLYLPRGLYKEVERVTKRRLDLADRLRDVTETCDIHAMAAWCALHVGRYREAIQEASLCIKQAEGVDLGSYLYGLSWRMCAGFMAGDWDLALADQSEIERIDSEEDHDLPRPYVIRAYGTAALCNQLLGNDAAANRYLSVCERFHKGHAIQSNLGGDLPALARTWVHRGYPDRAREILSFEISDYLSIHLEAMCEAVGAQGDWDEAAHLIPGARKEAERGGLLALPLFVDRLEGRSAAAAGRHERAIAALRRSAEGFSRLGARWETAWSRLLLAEVLATSGDKRGAEVESMEATRSFKALRSRSEIERAESLLARI